MGMPLFWGRIISKEFHVQRTVSIYYTYIHIYYDFLNDVYYYYYLNCSYSYFVRSQSLAHRSNFSLHSLKTQNGKQMSVCGMAHIVYIEKNITHKTMYYFIII